jgi:hypothetical protein
MSNERKFEWFIRDKHGKDWPVLNYNGRSEAEAIESWREQTGREPMAEYIFWSKLETFIPEMPEYPAYPKRSLGQALVDEFVVGPRKDWGIGEQLKWSPNVITLFLERQQEKETDRKYSLAWCPFNTVCGRAIFRLITWAVEAELVLTVVEPHQFWELVYDQASVIYYG